MSATDPQWSTAHARGHSSR